MTRAQLNLPSGNIASPIQTLVMFKWRSDLQRVHPTKGAH
jgi:hypothetical protein